MSINYPTSLDNFPNPTSTDLMENASPTLDHDVQHSNANDAIEALEAKVGVDGSAVTTSHDYKLGEVTGSDKAVGKTATQTLTNKTLTSPVINVGSDIRGDMYYRNGSGAFTRLPVGANTYILSSDGTDPVWTANPSGSDASTTVKGVVEIATTAEITAGTSTGGTGATLVVPASAVGSAGASKLVQFDGAGKYPAADGSAITNITNPAVYKSGNTTRDLSTATGTQTIAHGLGKTPKFVRITFRVLQTNLTGSSGIGQLHEGVGTFDGTAYATWYTGSQSGDTLGNYTTVQSTALLVVYERGGTGSEVSQKATASLDATNITLSWTKTGSPTGTLLMTWEAFA